MTIRLLTALPLVLAACSGPSLLPDGSELSLEAASADRTSVSATRHLFPDYTPRTTTTPENWLRLNRAQAPQGAIR